MEVEKNKRRDVAFSFHGGEVLYLSEDGQREHTLRDLVKKLYDEALQCCWVEEHVGNLSVFMDDPALTESDGRLHRILEGWLQTRGGGIVVALVSSQYFESDWCLTELSNAMKLFSQGPDNAKIRLCIIGVGITVDEMKNSWFMKEHGKNLHEEHEIKYDELVLEDATQDTDIEQAMSKAASRVADLIVERASGVLPGETQDETVLFLIEEIIKHLQGSTNGSLDYDLLKARFSVEKEQSPIDELIKAHNRQELLPKLEKFLKGRPQSDAIKACRRRLAAYKNKWTRPWCSTSWDASLKQLVQDRQSAVDQLNQHQRQTTTPSTTQQQFLPFGGSYPLPPSHSVSSVSGTSTSAVNEDVVDEVLDKLEEIKNYVSPFWCPLLLPVMHVLSVFPWVNRLWPVIKAPPYFPAVFIYSALACWNFPCGLWSYASSGINGNPKRTAGVALETEKEEYSFRRWLFLGTVSIVLAINLFEHGGPQQIPLTVSQPLSAFVISAAVGNYRLLELRAMRNIWGEACGICASTLFGGALFFWVELKHFTITHTEVSKLMAWSWTIWITSIIVAHKLPTWNTAIIAALCSFTEMQATRWMKLDVAAIKKPCVCWNAEASFYFYLVVAAVFAVATWVTMERSFREFRKEFTRQAISPIVLRGLERAGHSSKHHQQQQVLN